uniref:Uncharacterized protein n=1 Tax=Tanacetum cinerariifolium TaxID=118510 RepID=A0A699K3D1_TANCI|nr:hypothetical protein [Tanacetum cinerariifolium]
MGEWCGELFGEKICFRETSSKKNSSSTRLLYDPFISSYVGPASNSGVKVSTLIRFIRNAEKSTGVSISSSNEVRE